MSDMYVTEFSAPESAGHPHDLLAHLYREIGISAVAAALDALGGPGSFAPQSSAEPAINLDRHRLPAILRGEDLAA
jgi:hypothetical protein